MGCGKSREAEVVFAPDKINRSSIGAVAAVHARAGKSSCFSCPCGRRKPQPSAPRQSVFGDDEDEAPEADWWEGGVEGGRAVNIEYPNCDANSDDDEGEDEDAGRLPVASAQGAPRLEGALVVADDRPQPRMSRRVMDLERAAAQIDDGPQDSRRDFGTLEVSPIQTDTGTMQSLRGQGDPRGELSHNLSAVSVPNVGTELPKQAGRRPQPFALSRAPWDEEKSDGDDGQTPSLHTSKAHRPGRSAGGVGIEIVASHSQRVPQHSSSVGEKCVHGSDEGTPKHARKRKGKKAKATDNPPDLSLASMAGAFAAAIGDDLEQGGPAEVPRKDSDHVINRGAQQPAKSRTKKQSCDEKAARKRPKKARQPTQCGNVADDNRNESRGGSDLHSYEIMF